MKFQILLYLSFISVVNFAQQIEVSSKIDTNLITIGDQFTLTLSLKKSVNQDVSFPMLLDTVSKEIEIVEEKPVDTLSISDNIISLQKKYTLTSFDSGMYVLPQFNFTINNTDTDTVSTQETILLQVLTLQVDTTQQKIADIKQPFEAPMTFMEFLDEYYMYILGALILIALIILGLWYRKKLKNTEPKQKQKAEKPKEPAHIIALRDLEQLKEEKLWQNNRVKEYYVELTNILRKYLYNRFDIYAMEMTSDEIVTEIKQLSEVNEELKNKTRQFLTIADFVKFAKANPLPNDHDTSMKTVYTFVEETKQIPVETKNQPKQMITETENNTETK